MNPAIVSTSINPRPEAYAQWAKMGTLIVAGDLNSPPDLYDYILALGGTYLTVEDQDLYTFSPTIGWRNIQRRNAAIMLAYQQRFDPIITVDDDNFPSGNPARWVHQHADELDPARRVEMTIGSHTNFLNPGFFCLPRFHARGVPYGVNTDSPVVIIENRNIQVVVSQAQVLGDPDCDAVERLVNAPTVRAVQADVIVAPGCYAAFNSQATMWRRDWAPVMAVLPGIGRYDDIFASFIFHRLARTYLTAVHIGGPTVLQKRNEHDGRADLRAELWGMSNVFEFTGRLDTAHISADMPLWSAYSELIDATSSILPSQTVKFANEWVRTWRERV